MALEFGIPQRGVINAPLEHREPLRAEGNLNYLEFIGLVKYLWEEAHPDIDLQPTQANEYTKYPLITYGLELRKTFADEPKSRYREQIVQEDEDENYIIYGQRFTNLIRFTVITRNEPELCDQIIELFEEFMDEMTPVFKRLGVSEFTYGRRLPDHEGNRVGQDTCERAVAYMVVLERVSQVTVDKLEEFCVNARLFVDNMGTQFNVIDGDPFITVPYNEFKLGERVTIYNPNSPTDLLPPNLHHGWTYDIIQVNENSVYLADFNGDPVDPSGAGRGRIYLNDFYPQPTDLEDLYQTATPSS